ncbi:MAG: DUF1553 domain-containing protein [Planctomycetes bacterium]|nr:DUF1553 domain-containing protein [Planctomycetota bacterium]
MLATIALANAQSTHWAFTPVQRPTPPAGAAHPIDGFVRKNLAANGLRPAQTADRRTLIRRLYLVVLGVPPAPAEIDAFVTDPDPRAFEHLVDAVLADPRYGERQARHWLDVVRFAETNGFETNRERPHAWRYRDWVIAAINADLPFDQFVRDQIAGDAFGADAATGFLVGGPVDIVGSPDPALTATQRANEIDDMVATTGTAFFGLTVGCARCHDHKFDPISQREYHALAAVFAGVRHGDRALPVSAEQQAEVATLDREIAELQRRLLPYVELPPAPPDVGANRPPVDPVRNEERFAPQAARRVRFSIFATNVGEPCLDELEVWAGDVNVAVATAGAVATVSDTLPGHAIHQREHVNDGQTGNPRSWISNEVGGGVVQIEFARAERVDRIVWSRDRDGRFRDRLATAYRIELGDDDGVWREVASSADRRPLGGDSVATTTLRHRCDQAPAEVATWLERLRSARAARELAAPAPLAYAGTFVAPGPTHRFHRGDPMQPREVVPPGALALFSPFALPIDAPEQQRRIALAAWIGRQDHPLTARVQVNRLWQNLFGQGLVATPSDFGRNGARASHPELLDWLASEFVAGGMRSKAIVRRILTSATWQQASATEARAVGIDADNRLLWRYAPRRLEAEAIRDTILTVAGTLDDARGGPSFPLLHVDRENVYHYRPIEDFGPEGWRRMVYAFRVRMEPDAVFSAFDCPDGSLAMPKRMASTSPLQSLALFNSRFVLAQAERFATRLRGEAGETTAAQVERAFALAFGRAAGTDTSPAIAFAETEGLPALCRALLNANELLFIR